MVGDLEGQARRLIDFLGLDWDPACLEFYSTRRRGTNRQPWRRSASPSIPIRSDDGETTSRCCNRSFSRSSDWESRWSTTALDERPQPKVGGPIRRWSVPRSDGTRSRSLGGRGPGCQRPLLAGSVDQPLDRRTISLGDVRDQRFRVRSRSGSCRCFWLAGCRTRTPGCWWWSGFWEATPRFRHFPSRRWRSGSGASRGYRLAYLGGSVAAGFGAVVLGTALGRELTVPRAERATAGQIAAPEIEQNRVA